MMQNVQNMIKAHDKPDLQLQFREKDILPQRCILDSLLSQPTISKPSDMMRNTYECHPKVHYEPNPMHLKSIMLEHCYARPYNWRPDANFLRPTKTLFINQDKANKKKKKPVDDDEIDVDSVPVESPLIYDINKAKRLMDECTKYVGGIRDNSDWDEWEDRVPKINWSSAQHNMFASVVEILNSDRMARLTYTGNINEATLRRTVIDKSVKRYRLLMSKYSWDTKLVQWIHAVMVEYLSAPYLGAYLDILQSLRHKLPTFIDKLINGANNHSRFAALTPDNMIQLLKRVWDPVAFSLSQDKAKKLPGSPIIIVIPSGTSLATNTQSKRLTRWINLFSNIATVVSVQNNGMCSRKMTIMTCVDQLFAATRAKVQEVKTDYPNKPIVLVGFNSGAALALQVAQVESVLCTVSLGFSIYTAEGNRGDPEDNLLELQSPVLFVIGQIANTVLQEHMEDIRERMRVETGLLVVGGADDYLRVTKKTKRAEGITQSIVDRCIVDEVADFVSGLLLSPYPPQIRQSPAYVPPDAAIKRPKVERKRNNSNGSSLDSEPPSPTPRITRPVGRPPGSKAKSKIEAKWHAIQQGTSLNIPSSSSNSNSTTPPNPPSTPESSTDPSDFHNTIKTTSPTTTTIDTTTAATNAKLQAMGLYPGGMPLGKNLQQGGVRTLPPNPSKQIKVLDSVSITTNMSGKIIQSLNRQDLHKLNQIPSQCASTYGNNMVLMPDGRYKSAPPMPVRSNTFSPLTKLLTQRYAPTAGASSSTILPGTPNLPTARASLNKYITSKKQLQGNRPRQIKKVPYLQSGQSHLPPPTNLTSQDIMDLPIIFADDNQLLASNPVPPHVHTQMPQMKGTSTGKVLFLNKQFTAGPPGLRQNYLKRPSPNQPQNPVKYTKIILSKAPEDIKRQALNKLQLSQEIDNPTPIPMDIDLEKELISNKIVKKSAQADDAAPSYKTEAMTSTTLVNHKIKQAIEEMEMEDEASDIEFQDLPTS